MDTEELWRIYVSMTSAQRYYYRNLERKREENLQHYWENRERINEARRQRYRRSVEVAGTQAGFS